ncbi:hypothetical protein [Streptomyces inhibens]|uniref:hypothetical protein n=1 Tax=Streptomyces inhibens TaxID=2293571 RepID=UPI001EE72A95|nr:hypothetical protein [Streptomyces inhibens]UKY52834.1 hypothetical protein KI385_31215 [Streptomyces inhibens]
MAGVHQKGNEEWGSWTSLGSRYNGHHWSPATAVIGPSEEENQGPALTVFHSSGEQKLYGLYSSGKIAHSEDGDAWYLSGTKALPLSPQGKKSSPALVTGELETGREQMYAAWVNWSLDTGPDEVYYSTSTDGESWESPLTIPHVAITPDRELCAAVFKGKLFVITCNNATSMASFDGVGWTSAPAPSIPVAGRHNSSAVFGGLLYCGWYYNNDLQYQTYDGSGWGPVKTVPSRDSPFRPALAAFQDDILVCTFQAWDYPNRKLSTMYTESRNGDTWGPVETLISHQGKNAPMGNALAKFGTSLNCVSTCVSLVDSAPPSP